MTYPFEIHVTAIKANTPQLADFETTCEFLKVKPLRMKLSGTDSIDVMTSSKINGIECEATAESWRIGNTLSYTGYKVIRRKIETSLHHPTAVRHSSGRYPNNYFECHFSILSNNTFEVPGEKCYFSKNLLKEDNISIMTIRDNSCTNSEFRHRVEIIHKYLLNKGLEVEDINSEYCIFDSNQAHDKHWLGIK